MISGTSRDGADLALVRFENDRPGVQASLCVPYPDELAESLRATIEAGRRPDGEVCNILNRDLGLFFAQGVSRLIEESGVSAGDITAIGSHGQTVWHEPPESLQLGDPEVIASKTGIVTVGLFRQADLEAGGEGAPLAPLLHRALFAPETGQIAVLNIGGIANLSILETGGGVSGFDTGPGNCLMDNWIRRNLGEAFDDGGAWASQGTVIPPLLMNLLQDPWFNQPPPKSTGVEYFNMRWLENKAELKAFSAQDIQATLCQLTVQSIADALPASVEEVLVCGGGVHNHHLMQSLRAQSPGCSFESTQARGVDPNAVEAILFAWLARERLADRRQDTTSITGAAQPVLLGSVHHPEP
jgi:anhydro-N-acetylmuramic acid kinase